MEVTRNPIEAPYFCGIETLNDFIEPDPDIAGIGVILSFIIIGTAVLSLVSIKLYVVYKDDFEFWDLIYPPIEALRKDGRWPGLEDARKYLQCDDNDDSTRNRGIVTLDSTFFGLADTQFATGIAIGIATFAKQDITVYHYLISCEMSWLALISSTAGLLTARTVLDKANVVKKAIRITLMWTLFVLVATIELRRNDVIGFAEKVYAAEPYWDMSDYGARMAIVLFISTLFDMIIETISFVPEWAVLMYYYVETFVLAASPPLSAVLVSFFTGRCKDCVQSTGLVRSVLHFLAHIVTLLFIITIWVPVWLVSIAAYWISFQPIMAHIGNCVFFFWGVGSAFTWRERGRQCMKTEQSHDEDHYGFGQVVALTLLITPLIANADAWYGMCQPPTGLKSSANLHRCVEIVDERAQEQPRPDIRRQHASPDIGASPETFYGRSRRRNFNDKFSVVG